MSGLSAERPAPGLCIHQPVDGFRYAADAFWLAGFALEGGGVGRALDVGTGSGIVAWLLARRGLDVLAVDAWEGWAEAWTQTAAASRVGGRVTLRVADVRSLAPGAFDLVVCNPPYFPLGTGPEPEEAGRRVARFETRGTLNELVSAAVGQLGAEGRLCMVLPAAREAEAIEALGASMHAARVVRVGGRRVLLEARPGTGDTLVRSVPSHGGAVAAWYEAVTGGPSGP